MRDWLFMFMKDLVSLAAGYDCMFMSFVSTVCTTVFARQGRWREGWRDWTQFVSELVLCDWLGPLQVPASHRLGRSILHPSSPDANHFIPTYCVCGLAESFLLIRSGEMGGFRDSVVQGWVIWSWQPGRNYCLCLRGEGMGMAKGGRLRLHSPWLGYFDCPFGWIHRHVHLSSLGKTITLCDRDILLSLSPVLVTGDWPRVQETESKNGCWNINIYITWAFSFIIKFGSLTPPIFLPFFLLRH